MLNSPPKLGAWVVPIVPPSLTPVRFGPFEVDSSSGELRKQGVRVRLQEQPLQILQMLLEHPGQVVTRKELQQRLWPADTFVDFDHGLYNAVKRLREALGDTADTPRFIETIPKRGYRFIGTVASGEQVAASESSVSADSGSQTLIPSDSQTGTRTRWLSLPAGAASLVFIFFGLLIALNAGGVGSRVRAAWTKPPQIHSLAVLPLKSLSDDPAQEYFSYGMTEELITDLAQISGLKVISHTSALLYAKSSKSLPQIARELGVDGIVEGTVQRSGNQVRITAQLIYAPEDQHLWAASFDRDIRDALTLQSSVAAAIVEPIRSKTASPVTVLRRTQTPRSLEAMEDYLQGDYALERMGSGDGYKGYEDAIQYFNKSISEDPNFAPAYYKLAVTYDAQYALRQKDSMPIEKAALAKALELDPEFPDAHAMRASIKMHFDCDYLGVEKELREVIRLNPDSVEAHSTLASYLADVGHGNESIREAQRAQELDPEGYHDVNILMSNGQYDTAIERLRKHLELQPNDGFAYIDNGLINAYHFAGRYRESVEALGTAWTLFGFKEIGQGVEKAYIASGYPGALRYSARQMERLYAEGKVFKPDYIASWYARSGDREKSLNWLNIMLADNNYCGARLERDPDFAFLHSDPRFQELVKRLLH